MNVTQITVLGICVIFFATALGAFTPFLIKKGSKLFSVGAVGFSSGVMLAASVWSLILPALDALKDCGVFKILPVVGGIVVGCAFMTAIEKLFPEEKLSCQNSASKKPMKLFIAVTVHNIPEGLAVGAAFGAASVIGEYSQYLSALSFALGIAIQNVPEGAAVALPFAGETNNKLKGSLIGALSGLVEPVAAILGYCLSAFVSSLQPWLSSFAAGAMIFVVIKDLLPESYEKSPLLGAWAAVFGFLVMMTLDVVFG